MKRTITLIAALVACGAAFVIFCHAPDSKHPSIPATAVSGQMVHLHPQSAFQPVMLTPRIMFQMIRKQDGLHYYFSEKSELGESAITSGLIINPDEPYVYMWDEPTQTLWIATLKTTVGTTFKNGLSGRTYTTDNAPPPKNCPSKSEVPPDFAKAVTAMQESA